MVEDARYYPLRERIMGFLEAQEGQAPVQAVAEQATLAVSASDGAATIA